MKAMSNRYRKAVERYKGEIKEKLKVLNDFLEKQDEEVLKQVESLEKEVEKEEKKGEEIRKKAIELLKSPSFFYELGKVFEKGFIVPKINKPRFVLGEEENKRLVPLLLLGMKKGYTSLLQLVGESGTGKDTIVRMSLFLLKNAVKCIERGYITPGAVRYSEVLKGADILYIPDIGRTEGELERSMRLMRADDGGIISEYAYLDPKTKQMKTDLQYMPIKGIVTTTNIQHVSPALKSGMWRLETSSDPELTKRVKLEKLKVHEGKREVLPSDSEELKVWQKAFEILAKEVNVEPEIPYATRLMDLLDSERSESRRDPDKLCELIKLVAMCRYFQKPEDKRGEADLVDLYIALRIGSKAIEQTIAELSREEKLILDTVKILCQGEGLEEGVTVNQVFEVVSGKLGYTRDTVYRRLEGLVDKGYLGKDRKGRQNVYKPLTLITDTKLVPTRTTRLDKVKDVAEYVRTLLSELVNSYEKSSGTGKELLEYSKYNKKLRKYNIELIDPITGENVIVSPYEFTTFGSKEKRHGTEGRQDAKLVPQVGTRLGEEIIVRLLERLKSAVGITSWRAIQYHARELGYEMSSKEAEWLFNKWVSEGVLILAPKDEWIDSKSKLYKIVVK